MWLFSLNFVKTMVQPVISSNINVLTFRQCSKYFPFDIISYKLERNSNALVHVCVCFFKNLILCLFVFITKIVNVFTEVTSILTNYIGLGVR